MLRSIGRSNDKQKMISMAFSDGANIGNLPIKGLSIDWDTGSTGTRIMVECLRRAMDMNSIEYMLD